MSEELLQTKAHSLDRYLYWKLGSSTLTQLKNAKILPVKQIPSKIAAKKPDGLIAAPNAAIKAVIEYKTPAQLSSAKKIESAITQELEVARFLCKVLIISDGDKSLWINALSGEQITDSSGKYLQTFSAKRILDGQLTSEEIQELEGILDQIEHSLTETNNTLAAPVLLDPSALARTIWQKIWINTGKNPEQCLYNVVELFVFKFLSDVGVLEPHNNFDRVYTLKHSASAKDALEHYANISRKKIREMFPPGADGTTIINGTIFVNEKGQPNLAQARLFAEVIDHLQDYSEKHGSFRNIDREFKTRLYESFLRQEAGVKSLGQYFTPRTVVRAMVEMSAASTLQPGARICDPFCGVGGFVLETIADNPHIYKEFEPRNGIVSPRYILRGYDKGTDEKEDERTIILAKANMLIYFSDLLAKYNSPNNLKAFSDGAFNSVFKLIRSNLGTFSLVDPDAYDLILTNPPYVTSGSQSLKREIEEEGLTGGFTSGGRGTESLAIEWIIRHLKPRGQALIIVPDGLLRQTAVMNFVKKQCLIRGIVSLPIRTFYSTPKKTYILVLERKLRETDVQTDPVFTYLVSEIGETRDAKRFKLVENDLVPMVQSFNQFKGGAAGFTSTQERCKVIEFKTFVNHPHWMIDRYWTRDEKQSLGIEDEITEITEEDFYDLVEKATEVLVEETNSVTRGGAAVIQKPEFIDIELGDSSYFSAFIGQRVLKREITEEGVPVYSANVMLPFGCVKESILDDFTSPSLLWGIDGNFDWNLIPENTPFMPTDHCGVLRILSDEILPEYALYFLRATKERHGFDRTLRASLGNIRQLVLSVPVENGKISLAAQEHLSKRYQRLENTRARVISALDQLVTASVTY